MLLQYLLQYIVAKLYQHNGIHSTKSITWHKQFIPSELPFDVLGVKTSSEINYKEIIAINHTSLNIKENIFSPDIF